MVPRAAWGCAALCSELHSQCCKCTVTAGAQAICRGNAELEDISHTPAMPPSMLLGTAGQPQSQGELFQSLEIALFCSPHPHPPSASMSEQCPQLALPGKCFYF